MCFCRETMAVEPCLDKTLHQKLQITKHAHQKLSQKIASAPDGGLQQ